MSGCSLLSGAAERFQIYISTRHCQIVRGQTVDSRWNSCQAAVFERIIASRSNHWSHELGLGLSIVLVSILVSSYQLDISAPWL